MKLIEALKDRAAQNIANMPGWRTKRKLVVIESDDWGSIRMSSKSSYERLKKKNYPVDKSEYSRFDSLESNDDLEGLFEALSSVRDKNGFPAIVTANNIVANPHFDKIKENNYSSYYYELFTDTLKRYPNRDRVMDLYKTGIENKLVIPQLHGREHLNVKNWMNSLQQGNAVSMDAFEENMFTVLSKKVEKPNCRTEFLDGFGTYLECEIEALEKVINDAANLFKRIWGFQSDSIIAPCYIWHPAIEEYFYKNRIQYIQGSRVQRIPQLKGTGLKYKRHFTGEKNAQNQIYTVRNVFFEPCSNSSKDWVDTCLKEVQNSFFWCKPAVISSHRVNFIGSIDAQNRSQSLKLLKQLLQGITKKWPSVEFITTKKLGDIIAERDN